MRGSSYARQPPLLTLLAMVVQVAGFTELGPAAMAPAKSGRVYLERTVGRSTVQPLRI